MYNYFFVRAYFFIHTYCHASDIFTVIIIVLHVRRVKIDNTFNPRLGITVGES